MGKKKFFDKKKSATFQLMSRDSSDPLFESDPSADRVFVRVDTNPYTVPTVGDDEQEDYESNANVSIDGYNDISGYGYGYGDVEGTSSKAPLPDHVRREIFELGFPDDGYNYLSHLREIKNTGGGSMYYENSKAMLDELPHDVKAYDASRLNISKLDDDEPTEKSIYTVASKTVNVKIQRAVDPEIVQLLDDDSDVSNAGSDSDDLDEDFVIKANLPEESVEEDLDKKLNFVEKSEVDRIESKALDSSVSGEKSADIEEENSRARRLLDEQFDMLELQEYGLDCDDQFAEYSDEDEDQIPLAEKLNQAFKDRPLGGFENDGEYRLPLGLLQVAKGEGKEGESLEESAPGVILRTREYGAKYENEDEDEKEIIYEESSEDEDVWDCETIITTYSNLDNHPGKIGAPEGRRKKQVTGTISSDISTPRIIALKGKDKLPVDFLPRARKQVTIKEKDVSISKLEQQRSQESKEEKKERKAAVKEERRQARRMKKEMKELYKCEAHRAQKVAAFTGPSAIHLM